MSDDWNPEDLDSLLDAIEAVAPKLGMESLRELVHAGEDVIALEVLCDNLYESGSRLPPALFSRFIATCKANGVDECHWPDPKDVRSSK